MASEIRYRPEIDGLRALAVSAVVIYHAGEVFLETSLLPGGFLGVDVFFVISGYLISSIIFSGLDRGDFSLADFYRRRIRRILPVFLFIALISVPVAWLILLPEETQAYAKSLLASIFFISNIWFFGTDPYWADGLTRPFLHTWSLAVEEQFYIVAPALILVISRFARQWLLPAFALLGVLSLLYGHWMSGQSPDAAFYLLPSRMWELTAGILLALCERRGDLRALQEKPFTQHFALLGAAAIVASFLLYSSSTRHPSLVTVLPVLGVVLVITFANANSVVANFLSLKPLVGLGLISYGLYLWHYPIYAFGQRWVVDPSPLDAFFATILCVLLSVCSFYLIERPSRRATVSFARLAVLLLLGLVILLPALWYLAKDGLRYRFPEFLLTQESMPETLENYQWEMSSVAERGNLIAVGDSHMIAIAPQLKEKALASGFNFASSTERGCQLIVDTRRVRQDNRQSTHCTEALQSERLEFLREAPPSFVVLGGRLTLMLEERAFDNRQGGREKRLVHYLQNPDANLGTVAKRRAYIESKFRETVDLIEEMGHTVVLLYPIPEAGWHVPRKLIEIVDGDWINAREKALMDPIETQLDVFKQRNERAYLLLNALPSEQIIRVFPEKIFCSIESNRCRTHDGEHVFYRDEHHPSKYGATLIAEAIIQRLF